MITEKHKEFAAKYLADISKAIFAVALASNFFIELPMWVRIFLPITGIGFIIVALLILPGGKE